MLCYKIRRSSSRISSHQGPTGLWPARRWLFHAFQVRSFACGKLLVRFVRVFFLVLFCQGASRLDTGDTGQVCGMFMSGSKKVAVHCHGFSSMLHLGSTTVECTALLESHLQREFGKSRDLDGSMDVRRSAILCHNSTYHMNESHSCATSQGGTL